MAACGHPGIGACTDPNGTEILAGQDDDRANVAVARPRS
jgi:hypothetical protein